jgi:spore germination cell wall hydrolase CwlJ-like protein
MLILFLSFAPTTNTGAAAFPVSSRTVVITETLPLPKQYKNEHLTKAQPQYANLDTHDKKQIDCLAKNIYYESGGEPKLGWLAVAMVTMNRVNSGMFPTNICDVVYQKTGKIYQFSWVATRKHLTTPAHELYNEILEYAMAFYYKHHTLEDVTKGALFFHADYVNPRWNRVKTTQIGRHIFYR